jgi:DNA polymerase elongation subunit (family B)
MKMEKLLKKEEQKGGNVNLSEMSVDELLKLKQETINEICVYEIRQQAKKVSLNSAYGCMGGSFFRFYDIRNAEAITYTGQAVIKTIERHLNRYLQKASGVETDMVIAGDTDSTFLYLAPIVDKVFKDKNPTEEDIVNFLCSICDNNLQKVIDAIFADIIKTTNAFENHMHMKREKICASALWKAKKNYILNVWDNEGVRFDTPKIKISGIEGVKTSNPSICRQKIKTAIEYVMSSTEDELIQFIDDFKKEFFSLPPEDVSFPRSVSNIDKWMNPNTTYIKGTPKQARSAILYNKYIKEQNLIYKYPLIKNGEKIKYCCLKMPNPSGEDVIGFVQRFPEELGLKKYVDYDLHFEITFLQPLSSILNVIGWRTEKTLTLDDLF